VKRVKKIEYCSDCGSEDVLGIELKGKSLCRFCYGSTGSREIASIKMLLSQQMNILAEILKEALK
jgi:hypothetical protein